MNKDVLGSAAGQRHFWRGKQIRFYPGRDDLRNEVMQYLVNLQGHLLTNRWPDENGRRVREPGRRSPERSANFDSREIIWQQEMILERLFYYRNFRWG